MNPLSGIHLLLIALDVLLETSLVEVSKRFLYKIGLDANAQNSDDSPHLSRIFQKALFQLQAACHNL